jgi:hypothetical protein
VYLPGFAKSGDKFFVVIIFTIGGQNAKRSSVILAIVFVFKSLAGFVEASGEVVLVNTVVQDFLKSGG